VGYVRVVASGRALTLRERRALRAAIHEETSRLDDQIDALTRRFDDIVEAAELTSTDDEHDPEGATIAFERSQVSSLLRQTESDRAALRETLDRLDDDSYGTCEVCADFIGVERLIALPSTKRCVRCSM
jgi:DnaK suppressor protein